MKFKKQQHSTTYDQPIIYVRTEALNVGRYSSGRGYSQSEAETRSVVGSV